MYVSKSGPEKVPWITSPHAEISVHQPQLCLVCLVTGLSSYVGTLFKVYIGSLLGLLPLQEASRSLRRACAMCARHVLKVSERGFVWGSMQVFRLVGKKEIGGLMYIGPTQG